MNVLTEIHGQEDSYKILDETSSLPDVDILQSPRSRRKTDVVFLYVFAACVTLLLPFLIYSLCHSDINRLKGYDKCGNICGQTNVKHDRWDCTGQNLTRHPISGYKRCEDHTEYFWANHTIRDGRVMFHLVHKAAWKVTLVSFVPLALCLILIVLFRYAPAVAVWGILIVCWLLLTIGGLLLLRSIWFLWHYSFISMVCILSTLVLCSWILFNLKYIRMTSSLLKEATRALFEVKMMCFVPIGALSVLLVTLVIFTIISFHIGTSGKLTEMASGYLVYVPDNVMIATIVLNSIIAFWTFSSIIGVQDMIVSRAISQWYTAKNQERISDTVPISFFITVKYHLGTITLGSLLIAIMSIPRGILQFLTMFSSLKEKTDSWLRCLDGFFTNNSYIVTAMNGTSFIQSGKKAAKLLKLSIGNTRDLNLYANFVITMGQTLVVLVSTVGTFIMLHILDLFGEFSFFFSVVELGIAGFCTYTILGALKVSTNTLIFCATEELLRNKEADLPFTMTMIEVLDGSDKLLLQKVQSKPTSNVPEKSFYIKVFLFIFVAISCVLLTIACFI